MKRAMILIAASLLLAACATHAPGADAVRITTKADDIAGCEAVGNVHSTPPYGLPNEDYIQMRNAAVGLNADTVFVTSLAVVSRGVAYRCHRD